MMPECLNLQEKIPIMQFDGLKINFSGDSIMPVFNNTRIGDVKNPFFTSPFLIDMEKYCGTKRATNLCQCRRVKNYLFFDKKVKF